MVFNWNYRALGWFSLPSVWFFQIILVAITPMVDLFLLASLPFGAWRAVLPFVIVFLAMDVILATLACILERESILRAWRILPMRLIYRPMLSYVIWKAILRAIKGALVSWGNSSARLRCRCAPNELLFQRLHRSRARNTFLDRLRIAAVTNVPGPFD